MEITGLVQVMDGVWGCELHRQFHSNDAIVHIYWDHVIKPTAMLLNRHDIKLKFNANDYNNREQFVRLLAVAVFKWLLGLPGLPDHLLLDPARLLTAVSDNLPAFDLLHFLVC